MTLFLQHTPIFIRLEGPIQYTIDPMKTEVYTALAKRAHPSRSPNSVCCFVPERIDDNTSGEGRCI